MNRKKEKFLSLFYWYVIIGLVCYSFLVFVLVIGYLNMFHNLFPETLIPQLILLPISFILVFFGIFYFRFFMVEKKVLFIHSFVYFVVPLIFFIPLWDSLSHFVASSFFILTGLLLIIKYIPSYKCIFEKKF